VILFYHEGNKTVTVRKVEGDRAKGRAGQFGETKPEKMTELKRGSGDRKGWTNNEKGEG